VVLVGSGLVCITLPHTAARLCMCGAARGRGVRSLCARPGGYGKPCRLYFGAVDVLVRIGQRTVLSGIADCYSATLFSLFIMERISLR
jgi:hypothetical protein